MFFRVGEIVLKCIVAGLIRLKNEVRYQHRMGLDKSTKGCGGETRNTVYIQHYHCTTPNIRQSQMKRPGKEIQGE